MEAALIVIGIFLMILGFVGCFIPVLPGPPLGYVSLLLLQIGPEKPFTLKMMLITGSIVVLVTVLDYIIPALGTKKWGGSKYGMIGAIIGVIGGLFFPPFGLLFLPLVGAVLGELINGASTDKAFKSAIGTLAGLIFGTFLKFSVTVFLTYLFFTNL